MKTSVKWALATGGLAVVGGLFLAGATVADPGFGHGGRMGMMGAPVMEMLKGVDTNSDAALSQDEINAAVNTRYASFDGDKNASLSLEEFQALWADLTRPMAVRAFQFLDPNGDASLARAEVDERFGSLVSRFDRNDDGMLSHDDHQRGGRGGRGGWHGRGGGGGDDERRTE